MKEFAASDVLRVETSRDMDPTKPGTTFKPGLMKAMVFVYEPGDGCEPHPSLPTLGELIAKHTDPATGMLVFHAPGTSKPGYAGLPLLFDAAALRDVPRDWIASYGASFVTYDALDRAGIRPAG